MTKDDSKRDIMSKIFRKFDVPFAVRTAPTGSGYQFIFPWTEGDVITDPFCGYSSYENDYVESFAFPWDEGDVTRDFPQQIAQDIVDYYEEIMEDQNDPDDDSILVRF